MTLLAFLLACSPSVSDSAASRAGVPYPHPDHYDEPIKHGAETGAFGVQPCLGCHREGATAPACESCHGGYPHEPGWLDGATHGRGLTGDAGPAARVECSECHGAEGLQAPACTTCHASWPHPDKWKEAGNHGVYALARGSAVAACGSCHGAALEGAGEAASCVSCHASYPHVAGWAEATAHGATADYTACWTCHGEGGESGGAADVTCHNCHTSYPHPDGWESAHYATATLLGEVVCAGCHEAGSAPLPVVAACGARCHGVP